MSGSGELRSLLILLEDKDPATLDVVRDRVFAIGWRAVEYFYLNLDSVVSRNAHSLVSQRIRDLSSLLAFRELLALMDQGQHFYVPDGMYYLSRIVEPELMPEAFRGVYEEMGNALACRLRDTMTAVEKIEMLNYVMYDKFGFTLDGNIRDGEEKTSRITRLMTLRKGGAVGLSSVYFLLASYAGLPVYPLFPKNPGYFVAYFEGGESLFTIDVGNRGHISEPVPKEVWKETSLMGTDQTILYIYAASLKRFGAGKLSRMEQMLLSEALEILRV